MLADRAHPRALGDDRAQTRIRRSGVDQYLATDREADATDPPASNIGPTL
jgi:hypothetical protein